MSWNFSGAVVGSVGSVQFQIVPCPRSYLFSVSVGPLQCLGSANYRALICHCCHFQSGSRFFILASSVCRSLQCLISALRGGGEGGHLFRLTCSVVLCCGGALHTNVAGVCGERSQCTYGPHGVCPSSRCVLPGLRCSGSRVPCRGAIRSGVSVSCPSRV